MTARFGRDFPPCPDAPPIRAVSDSTPLARPALAIQADKAKTVISNAGDATWQDLQLVMLARKEDKYPRVDHCKFFNFLSNSIHHHPSRALSQQLLPSPKQQLHHNYAINQKVTMTTATPTLYLNIHTTSPSASAAFFTALNFSPVPAYSDTQTQSLRLPAPNSSICLMLHDHARFKTFIRPGTEPNDARKTTEVLFSIAAETKDEVDGWVERAVGAGGEADPYVMEGHGEGMGMYVRSFGDLDGHVWEVVAMTGTGTGGCGVAAA